MIRALRVSLAGAALTLAGACAPEVQISGTTSVTPELRRDYIQTADGTLLPLRAWLPRGKPKAVILGLHGMNDYNKSFTIPAESWMKEGIATYAYDQRGYGNTPQRGVWPGTGRLVSDFGTAVALVRRRHPGVPIYASGTSMGGGVVLAAMARPDAPKLDGIILEAPAVWSRETMPPYYTATLWLASHTVPGLHLSGRELERVVTDNKAVLRDLSRDPYVLKGARVDALYGVVDLMDAAYDAAAKVKVPVLLLYGEKDQIIPKQPIEAVARRLPEGLKRFALYDKGYHLLFRDLQAAVVHRDVIAWVANRSAPLPSGADSKGARFLAGAPSAGGQ
ncbi:MAG TPA: lysophospholipase [Alphaproteobacteria bacterium]|jgi:alpha-beta hydrolase superfamily lysophospholipase